MKSRNWNKSEIDENCREGNHIWVVNRSTPQFCINCELKFSGDWFEQTI